MRQSSQNKIYRFPNRSKCNWLWSMLIEGTNWVPFISTVFWVFVGALSLMCGVHRTHTVVVCLLLRLMSFEILITRGDS